MSDPSTTLPPEIIRDLGVFAAHRQEWLEDFEGKHALIHDGALVGMFDNQENAYLEAIKQFGNVPVLIKQVTRTDPAVNLPALSLGLIDARP